MMAGKGQKQLILKAYFFPGFELSIGLKLIFGPK
jgi:hypothetical protein